jgi:hypothetical protein
VFELVMSLRYTLMRTMGLSLVGVALLVCAAGAQASRLRVRVPSVVSFAADGSRYAAWQVRAGAPIVVLDTDTGAQHVIPNPGCNLENEEEHSGDVRRVAATGEFMLSCVRDGGPAALLNVRSGTSLRLPTESLSSEWNVLGARYVEGYTQEDMCSHDSTELKAEQTGCIMLFQIASGAVSYRPQGQVVNLDAPGAPRACPAVQRRGYLLRTNGFPTAYGGGVLAIEGSRHNGDVQIVRCHGHPAVIPGLGGPRDFSIGGGLLTWDNGLNPTIFGNPRQTRTLTSYRLANGKRRNWPLPFVSPSGQEEPSPPEPYGYSAHTANTVFWIAPRTLESVGVATAIVTRSTVYSARL